MAWPGYSPILTIMLLAALGFVGVVVSLWRIAQGDSTQRLRGCLSLVMIAGTLVVVGLVALSFFRVKQLLGPSNGPSQSTPDTPWSTTPITGPSFATPTNGVSAP